MQTNLESAIPFLRWAGGKRWLTRSENVFCPQNFNTYLEPFLGSGAVFFYLNPEKAILSDINADLINTDQAIKDDFLNLFKKIEVDDSIFHTDKAKPGLGGELYILNALKDELNKLG